MRTATIDDVSYRSHRGKGHGSVHLECSAMTGVNMR